MGSSGGFFVRGAEDSQVLILIDGVRTASATNGATAIELIPLDSIERIEIIKGPMSGIYGLDAIGGVIQIFTKQADQNVSLLFFCAGLKKPELRQGDPSS